MTNGRRGWPSHRYTRPSLWALRAFFAGSELLTGASQGRYRIFHGGLSQLRKRKSRRLYDDVTSEHHGWRARYLPTASESSSQPARWDGAEEFMSGLVVSAARDQHSLITGRALVTEAAGQFEEARHVTEKPPSMGGVWLCPGRGTSASRFGPLSNRTR